MSVKATPFDSEPHLVVALIDEGFLPSEAERVAHRVFLDKPYLTGDAPATVKNALQFQRNQRVIETRALDAVLASFVPPVDPDEMPF